MRRLSLISPILYNLTIRPPRLNLPQILRGQGPITIGQIKTLQYPRPK